MKRRTTYTILGAVVAVLVFAIVWATFFKGTAVGDAVQKLAKAEVPLMLKGGTTWSEAPYERNLAPPAPFHTTSKPIYGGGGSQL